MKLEKLPIVFAMFLILSIFSAGIALAMEPTEEQEEIKEGAEGAQSEATGLKDNFLIAKSLTLGEKLVADYWKSGCEAEGATEQQLSIGQAFYTVANGDYVSSLYIFTTISNPYFNQGETYMNAANLHWNLGEYSDAAYDYLFAEFKYNQSITYMGTDVTDMEAAYSNFNAAALEWENLYYQLEYEEPIEEPIE